MARYTKENARIPVKFIDGDTEEILFEIQDRNWMSIGEIFSTTVASDIIVRELKNHKLPSSILVIAVSEYKLQNE
jgi:hypothetical protein